MKLVALVKSVCDFFFNSVDIFPIQVPLNRIELTVQVRFNLIVDVPGSGEIQRIALCK